MLKSKSTCVSRRVYLGESQLVYLGVSQNRIDFDFDFKILTA